ncbi:MAG: decarboxylating 6-phosphogluconate dehydrogenase [Thaumarchaeota archaeon]|nr:decarboxylating 6-phosphogluconate dehydrogenase [Nitrososphaerota archaeon]
MKVGFIGLGRMGSNMVLNLLDKKLEVVVWNRSKGRMDKVVSEGAEGAESIAELCGKLSQPRVVWIMVPAGRPVDDMISKLTPNLGKGDIIIEGGNTFYKDSIRRSEDLRKDGIFLLDVGTSGGLEGARHGACLTIGGEQEAFEIAEPIFDAVSEKGGYLHVGRSGSGHYVKITHNGIEYAMLQAYGEGFESLQRSEFELNLAAIAKVWNNGSVIRSWLLKLAGSAIEKDPRLEKITDYVGGGTTGKWAIDQAWESDSPFSLIALAYSLRIHTRMEESFAGKVVAATRNEFGGHEVKLKE